MPRAKRGLSFICPRRSEHTPCPAGYIAWHEWAEKMGETHDQVKCPGCDRYAIWMPRQPSGRSTGNP